MVFAFLRDKHICAARAKLDAALAKPVPQDRDADLESSFFDPWEDVLTGIDGGYASSSDALAIEALEAVRDKTTFEFVERVGFAGEFMLYVLSGPGYTEYGTSPRGGWADPAVAEVWDALIAKWREYYEVVWEEPVERIQGVSDV